MITRKRPTFREAMLAVPLLIGAAAATAAPAQAQQGPAPVRPQQAVPGTLDLAADHWWRAALVRLHAAGAVAAHHDPAAAVGSIEIEATASGRGRRLAAGYLARLAREYDRDLRPVPWILIEAGPLLLAERGRVRAGHFTLDRTWVGPAAAPDRITAGARADVRLRPAAWLAGRVEAMGHGPRWAVEHAAAEVTAGVVSLWAGRRVLSYRPTAGGGLVLSRLERVDGAGVSVRPAPLPLLGISSAQLFAGGLPANGHVRRPWLLGMRVHAAPHDRFDIGATRAAVFGGMDGARLGVRELLTVAAGANLSGAFADDQVAAVDARWRPPSALPLELFGEWGVHDIDPGVLFDVPAFTLGVRLPAVGLMLEHTQISGSCCGNPPWYHHFELANGWTRAGVPIGHTLGGHGREWRATAVGSAAASRVVHEAHAYIRRRGAENLYAPGRAGPSTGLELHVDALAGRQASVRLDLAAERGSGWRELRATARAAWRF